MVSKWQEAEDAIVFGIMSGHNECGTLETLAGKGGDDLEKFLRGMIYPALKQRAGEEAQLQKDFSHCRQSEEKKRFALEMVISNNGDLKNPDVRAAIQEALPGHPLI